MNAYYLPIQQKPATGQCRQTTGGDGPGETGTKEQDCLTLATW